MASFDADADDQVTVRQSRSSDSSNSGEESLLARRRQTSGLGKAPMREESASTSGYQADTSSLLDRLPSSASSSRRYATSSRPERRSSYQSSSSRHPSTKSTSSRRTSTSQRTGERAGTTPANSTDFTSDEDGTPTISRSSSRPILQNTRERAASRTEVIIPRWQPDSEVTHCPICHTAFGWLNRKHHCRKCGRVVCNSCSPHRITIPYQYIVQPSDHLSPYISVTYNRLHDPQEGRTNYSPEFGGGERVRLCNPCVPDPNIAPPQTNQTGYVDEPRHGLGYHGRTQSSNPTAPTPSSLPNEARFRLADTRSHPMRESTGSRRNPTPGLLASLRTAEDFQNWYRDRDRVAANNVQGPRSRSSTIDGTGRNTTEDMRTFLRYVPGPSSSYQEQINTRGSATGQRYNMSGEASRARPLPRAPQIAEEDECPICHRELPSSSLPNAETLRSEHIVSCIENATSRLGLGSTSDSRTTTSSPRPPVPITQPSSQSSSFRASTSPIPRNSSSSSTPPSQPPRRTGVFPYIATEKDCQDDAECQICLEEYEPGVQMGRLECFCKFHLGCIRQWFEKHPGRCPMHQHDAYGY